MAKNYITPEDGKKLEQLWKIWAQVRQRTHEALVREGMSSEAFSKANAEEGAIVRQIKEIQGRADVPWMAA